MDFLKSLEAVREAVREPVQSTAEQVALGLRSPTIEPRSAEQQIEERIDRMITELDELCCMASNKETVDLVEGQSIALGQLQTRIQLVLSFLAARKPISFRIVRNG